MVLSDLVAAVVALTLHRLVALHCACVPVPSRPTCCRLSPPWPGLRGDASTKQCAMCSGCVKWEASCHQTACSLSFHTQLFTYNLLNLSILHHLLCLPFFPRLASFFVFVYWKKLTCGLCGPLIGLELPSDSCCWLSIWCLNGKCKN